MGWRLTGSSDWRLRLDGPELTLTVAGRTHLFNAEEESAYRVQPGMLWTGVTFYSEHGRSVAVDGLPNAQGAALTRAFNAILIEKRLREELELLDDQHRMIDLWLEFKASQELAWPAADLAT